MVVVLRQRLVVEGVGQVHPSEVQGAGEVGVVEHPLLLEEGEQEALQLKIERHTLLL